ncbi:MAG: bifunctional phosphopantothenoylcysteine decarboxylase/phosphopantothenate--cysteine ligase CoaBC [Armatimonadota bacterium]
MNLAGKTIILGITGGIAAYKSADICSRLVKVGASVHVVMTENAEHFVGSATFRAITGQQVIQTLWDEPREYEITHVSLPDKADLFLVAPATANIIGKAANGIADDMLSTMIMAAASPVVFAPAMNCRMWENPVTQANIQKLQSLGYKFIEPETGRLACGTEGIGRLASVDKIIETITELLLPKQDLDGISILVTAGPTREPIDPVRFIMNQSSGKMGYAIAEAASRRGARVTLVSGPTSIPAPPGVDLVKVETSAEMFDAVMDRLPDTQVIIGAAAPADFTPASPKPEKIKKSGSEGLTLELVQTRDIMAEVGKRKDSRILVAFAAETENLIPNAQEKMVRKNVDLIVANDVSRPEIGFGSDDNEVAIIGRDGHVDNLPRLPKIDVADRILDRVKQIIAV